MPPLGFIPFSLIRRLAKAISTSLFKKVEGSILPLIGGMRSRIPKMIPGAPVEARWLSSEPRRDWPLDILEAMVRTGFPKARIIQAHALTQGRRNANFKLDLSSISEPVVLRIYQHDISLCQKEIDIIRLIQGSVPVPEIIYGEPDSNQGLPPFVLMRCLDGITLRELKKTGDTNAIAQAARSAGRILAHISSFRFETFGWLGPGPRPTAPLLPGANAVPRFVDACLASEKLQVRLPTEWRERTSALMWSSKNVFDGLPDQNCLVHGDFNKRNLLVAERDNVWAVTGVLDWEFAISGSPLGDFGNLLRYERSDRPNFEPHFSRGYLEEGGHLPPNWKRTARLLDMIALCETLTHDELPQDVTMELTELVRAAVEDRDPEL